jgi:hypothetical protein
MFGTPLARDLLQCILQRGAVLNMVELQGNFCPGCQASRLNNVLGALQEDWLKKGTLCALMMPFASVFVENMVVGKRGYGGR